MLEIKGLSKSYNGIRVLDGLDLQVRDGEFLCILGPSGCGKTTLLRIIAGLEKADRGTITLDGRALDTPNPRVGMVFQEYALFPWRNVLQNITFGREIAGVPEEEREREARAYLELLGLKRFEKSYPHELSGGMRQRVALARTLINNPSIILMDEPFGALDAQTRNHLQGELLKIWDRERKTILFVTHSVDEAVYLADRVVVMSARPGKIKEVHPIELSRPRVRTSLQANQIRDKLLSSLGSEIAKTI